MVQRHRGCTRKLLQNTKLQRMRTTHSSFQYFFHGMVFHTGPFFLSLLRNFFKECRIRMKRRYGIFLQRFMHHPIYCAARSSLRCNPLLSKVAFSYCSYLSWIKQKMQNFAQMVHFQITKWVCFIFTLHSVWKNPPKTYLIYLFSSAKEYEFSRQNVISLEWDCH